MGVEIFVVSRSPAVAAEEVLITCMTPPGVFMVNNNVRKKQFSPSSILQTTNSIALW